MTFLDKKEQVLDIQLTQYGKYLLSKGKLKPVYYGFFDDDIIYDSTYAGFEEEQKETQNRILNQARTETQYVYDGLETNIKKSQEIVRSGFTPKLREKIQKTSEKHYALSAPIGNSSLLSDKMPAWNLDILYGEISGSVASVAGDHQTLKIPQINMKSVTYETIVRKNFQTPEEFEEQKTFSEEEGTTSDLTLASSVFKDGTYIDVREDFMLLQLREENSVFSNENFDVEVFLVEEQKTNLMVGGEKVVKEVLSPLLFKKMKPKIVNNILLDEEDQEENLELDPRYADYFFYVHIDNEIERDVLCRNSPIPDRTLSEAGFFNDFECPDVSVSIPGVLPPEEVFGVSKPPLYESDVTLDDLVDPCDDIGAIDFEAT